MQTKINELLDLHNDMWVTLHRLKKANTEHKLIKNGAAGDVADSEEWIASLVSKYSTQYNELKSLTETI